MSVRRIVESDVNADDWRLELEEVAPYLVLRLNPGNNWTTRIESMEEYRDAISNIVDSTSGQLKHIADEILQSLKKIETREKNLVADQNVMGISGLVDKLKSHQKDLQDKASPRSIVLNNMPM